MKKMLSFAVVLALVVSTSLAWAGNVESGLKAGETINAFYVTKYAGNATDGVENGKTLCYRCKLGSRPVVAIFARSVNDDLASLIKQIDAIVARNEEKKMASFVNLMGDDTQQLKKDALALVEKSAAKNIAVVVPAEGRKGWDSLKLNEAADVTVLIYKNATIVSNHAFASGELDKTTIAAIISDTDKILE